MGEKLKQRLKQKNFENLDQESMLNIYVTANFLRSKNDSALAIFKLTLPQYNVLRILKGKYPEGYARCDIIERMIEPAPDVTRLVDRLCKEKLAERFQSDSDRRLSLTRITQKGIKLLNEVKPNIDSLNSLISEVLGEKEKETLSSLLEKIYGPHI